MTEVTDLHMLKARVDAWAEEQAERRRYEERRVSDLQREVAYAAERARQVELFSG